MYVLCLHQADHLVNITPNLRSSSQTDSLSTKSKAYFRSTYAIQNGCAYSLLVWIRVFNVRILSVVDRPGAKPLCSRRLDCKIFVVIRQYGTEEWRQIPSWELKVFFVIFTLTSTTFTFIQA